MTWWQSWRSAADKAWADTYDYVASSAQAILDADPLGVKAKAEANLGRLRVLWDRAEHFDQTAQLPNVTEDERSALWRNADGLRANVLNVIGTMQMDPEQVLGVKVPAYGIAPLVVGALTVVALAALYVVSELIDQWDHATAAEELETRARWDLNAQGKQLQKSTVDPESRDSLLDDLGETVMSGGAALVGLAVVGGLVWAFAQSRGRS